MNSVTSIGNYAFEYCSRLTSAIILNSVTNIGTYAFAWCSGLTNLTIGNSVTSIGAYAFCNCPSPTSVIIPNSVTSIGNDEFCGCSGLTSVIIPDSVSRIGAFAFRNCSGLTNFVVNTGNLNYASVNGVLFNKSLSVLVQYPLGKNGGYSIPDSVTSIGGYAFTSCSGLTSVTIGNSLTNIGNGAFDYCSGLTGVYFRGNAPSYKPSEFDSTVFLDDSNATVYHLAGTTGWGSTFDKQPTAVWVVPATPTLSARYAASNIVLTWSGGVLLESTNLATGPWTTNSATSPFTNTPGANAPVKFYRARNP